MRLFFSVPIPTEISREITAESKKTAARSLRWIAPENQHFTLRFLGEIKEGRVAEFISAGQETARKHHPFLLTISGSGFFPDEVRPGVFWVGTGEGSERIVALADGLSRVLNEGGFPSEDRPFIPHLTVARVKGRVPPEILKKLALWREKDFGSFKVNEFCLMESLLLPTGVVYQKVHSFSLEALNGKQG